MLTDKNNPLHSIQNDITKHFVSQPQEGTTMTLSWQGSENQPSQAWKPGTPYLVRLDKTTYDPKTQTENTQEYFYASPGMVYDDGQPNTQAVGTVGHFTAAHGKVESQGIPDYQEDAKLTPDEMKQIQNYAEQMLQQQGQLNQCANKTDRCISKPDS
jgi:hypothetical protein